MPLMPYNRVYKNCILYMNVILRFGHQLRVYTVYNIIIVPVLLLINSDLQKFINQSESASWYNRE